jgi:hypothetical protein
MAGYNIVFGPNNLPSDFIDQNGNYKKNTTGSDIIVEHDGDYFTIPACSDNYLLCWYGSGGQNLIYKIANTNIDFKNINEGEFVASVDNDDFKIYGSYSGSCLTAAFGSKSGSINFVASMFEGTDITELCLPSCYTSEIPSRCFYSSDLVKINLEDINTIKSFAFANCGNLASIEFPSRVTTIEEGAFENSGLNNSVIIPNTVTSMGNGVFKNCSYLQSATVNNSDIGESQFEGCSSLSSVTLNNSNLTTLSSFSFKGCTSLTEIGNTTSPLNIPSSITTIEDNVFEDCTGLTHVNIPDSVTSIGNNLFKNCTSLTEATIGNTTTGTPSNTFAVKSYTFKDCSSLEKVYLGNNIRSINNSGVFDNCSSLTDIYIYYDGGIVSVSNYTISSSIARNVKVHVPSSLLNTYKEDLSWIYAAQFNPDNFDDVLP